MHRKLKVLIAGWLASRIESRTRRVRRALRDHQRAEVSRAMATQGGDRNGKSSPADTVAVFTRTEAPQRSAQRTRISAGASRAA